MFFAFGTKRQSCKTAFMISDFVNREQDINVKYCRTSRSVAGQLKLLFIHTSRKGKQLKKSYSSSKTKNQAPQNPIQLGEDEL
jgi:hypothetical protein